MVGRVKLIIDKKAISHNITEFKRITGPHVEMCLIHKSNSYGTELYKKIDFFKDNNVTTIGVATANEAVCMREVGFTGDIFLLYQPLNEEIPYIVEFDLTSGVCHPPFISELNDYAGSKNKCAKVHLKINTGMNRMGVKPVEVKEISEQIRGFRNIELEGIYTHFSSSDDDEEYTNYQISEFNKARKSIGQAKLVHACNTMGILNYQKAHYNMVRLGTGQYGYLHNPVYYDKINLKPALSLKTNISFIHTVDKGVPLAYNASFVTARRTKIAVIPIGYGDGLTRKYKGRVFVSGCYADIAGTVSMDATLIDITDIPNVNIGDDVYIWDNKNITIEEFGKNYRSIFAEIFGHLSSRIERVYI